MQITRREAFKILGGFAALIVARNLPSIPTLQQAVEQNIIPSDDIENIKCCLTDEEIASFLTEDCNRISGRIAQQLSLNSPWIDIIENN